MTETNTDTLTLMVLSSDYPTYERWNSIQESALEGNDGVFYVMSDPNFNSEPNWHGPGWAVVVVADDDPRHLGMWVSRAFPGHHGWNVPARFLTPYVEDSPSGTPDGPESGSETALVETLRGDVTSLTERLDAAHETIANLRASMSRQASEFESWKARATEIAHAYANDNSLCSEFDQCMEEIGLEGRQHEYRVTVSMLVTATSDDEAWEIYCELYAGDYSYAEIDRAD